MVGNVIFHILRERKGCNYRDMDVQIRGPRCNVKENERSTYFLNFLQRCDLLSVNVQMQCTGPCYTFFPETGNYTLIDHIIVESSIIDLVENVYIIEENEFNLSEHVPVIGSILIPVSAKSLNATSFLKFNWKKALSDNLLCFYQLAVHKTLSDVCIPEVDVPGPLIDKYYRDIASAIIIASRECIPEIKYRKFLKPYWSNELSDLHNIMVNRRNVWINEGQPRGIDSPSFKEYKSTKTEFRRNFVKHLINICLTS